MRNWRLLAIFSLTVLLITAMAGCNWRGRTVRAEPPPPFQSPITEPVGGPGMSLAMIREELARRATDLRAIRATMTITVGETRSNVRQQFDALAYSAPPGFLRVRGSADAGTVFDLLIQDHNVQAVVVPEQKYYQGTVAGLRNNPALMAGLQPDDLINSFFIDTNLYRILAEFPNQSIVATPDHYQITVDYPNGVREVFSLRQFDLLVDRVERSLGRRSLGSVRFDSYQFYGSKHLVPNRFEATLPNGAVATIEASEIEPNVKRNKELEIIDIPEGFQHQAL